MLPLIALAHTETEGRLDSTADYFVSEFSMLLDYYNPNAPACPRSDDRHSGDAKMRDALYDAAVRQLRLDRGLSTP